ncbi:Uncharacterised protein [Mycobacteroides abscessus subsp. abscessus]|nr:Uncharacterised protein [Mycobacteroides abscessus subsp. abscessus]
MPTQPPRTRRTAPSTSSTLSTMSSRDRFSSTIGSNAAVESGRSASRASSTPRTMCSRGNATEAK